MMFRHLFLVLLSIAGTAPAQDASTVSVRTLAFDLPVPAVELSMKREDAEATQTLGVQVNQFGTLAKLAPGTYTASSASFASKETFKLPAGESGSFLLLVLSDKKGQWKILPVADDASRFAAGDRFMINATVAPVAVRFDKQRIRLDPGRSSYFKSPVGKAEGDKIEIEMFQEVKGALKPFNSTYWPVAKDLRTVVLIYPDLRTGKPRVRSLADMPESATAGN
ncbi:hypothetical protein OKA04_18190 [Luteolibacter flavescens]|uniref:Uncharacterized protein n=1 Tax=Luteolibacter flavescens TaxID=1859460 RepID=A0ABT3FSW4_9BACT|nr:hypothetical protein [Luteolibacter flavescens]MCW1886674.1 hypothetical protein [Luteolibacter flavescens]